ncbi:MAG: hypothetical protein WD875_18195 [Pirellulales bacterium]
MSDRDLLAALDACRPGESEWDDPALANVARRLDADPAARQLRSRVEYADRRLEAALHAMQPPAGLADCLLSRLAAAGSQSGAAASDTPANEANAPNSSNDLAVEASRATPPAIGGGRWRRRAFVASGVVAVAATVMLAIHLWPEPPQPWTAEQVLDAAIGLCTRDARTDGNPLAEAPSDRMPSRQLIKVPANTQWRRIEDAMAGSDAIAYYIDLAPGGPRATLLVVSPAAPVSGLADYPPSQPATPTTQGVCAAAWQEGDLVYVLVVEGGPHEYKQFLRPPGGDWTWQQWRARVQG